MASYDLILRGGTVVLPWGEAATDVAVRAGRIVTLGDLRTEEAAEVIETGVARLLEFGVADETAWRVGLSCGGRIGVYVEKIA